MTDGVANGFSRLVGTSLGVLSGLISEGRRTERENDAELAGREGARAKGFDLDREGDGPVNVRATVATGARTSVLPLIVAEEPRYIRPNMPAVDPSICACMSRHH